MRSCEKESDGDISCVRLQLKDTTRAWERKGRLTTGLKMHLGSRGLNNLATAKMQYVITGLLAGSQLFDALQQASR